MFGYGVDRRAISILFMILIAWSLMSMTSAQWISLLLTLPAVVIAITFHEYAHANAADKLGDTTPRHQGRLTLNPISHLDLFGFLLLMFAGIGWGKPVQVNPNNYTSNRSRGFCDAMVALAGPLMNFFIALIACILYLAIYYFGSGIAFFSTTFGSIITTFLAVLMSINIGLGVFNLIPLPPLDGEKIFKNILPYRVKQWLDNNYATLSAMFMILWFFGILEVIVSPVVAFLTNGLMSVVEFIFRLFI